MMSSQKNLDADYIGMQPQPMKINYESLNKMEKVKMPQANIYDVNNLINVIDSLAGIFNQVKNFLNKGSHSLFDKISFGVQMAFSVLPKLPILISSFKLIPVEVTDKITDDERKQIYDVLVKNGVVGSQDEIVDEALALAISVKNFVFKYFIK